MVAMVAIAQENKKEYTQGRVSVVATKIIITLQIGVNGILFTNISARSKDEINLTSTLYPAVLPIPSTAEISETIPRASDFLIPEVDVIERILHYRIVSSDNRSSLTEIDSVLSKFNSDLTDFEPTTALIATWEIRIDSVTPLADSSESLFFPFVVS